MGWTCCAYSWVSLTPKKIGICRKANAIVEEEVKKEGLDSTLWQYFAVLTDTKVTGVKGDIRDYGYLVVLRMVESIDAMTANVPELPWKMVKNISQRINTRTSSDSLVFTICKR